MFYVSYHKTNSKVNCNQDEIGTKMKQTFKRAIFIKIVAYIVLFRIFMVERHLFFAIDNATVLYVIKKWQCFTLLEISCFTLWMHVNL